MMNNESEKFAGIFHHNPVQRLSGCNGNPRYISTQSFYTIKNGEQYLKRFNKLPLLPDLLHSGKGELWINRNGYIEKRINTESVSLKVDFNFPFLLPYRFGIDSLLYISISINP